MIVTPLVSYYALHAPQNVAVSRSEPLNHSAPSTETVFAYLDSAYPDTQVLVFNNLFLDELLVTAEEFSPPFPDFDLRTPRRTVGQY